MRIGNIFCDASMDLSGKIGCAGTVLVSEDFSYKIDEIYMREYYATNNSSEILAIYNGVILALKYKRLNIFDSFRLFSDSKICIYGLRQWCYDWVKNQNEFGFLLKSDGQHVANQEYFKNIIRLIIDNDLNIYFIHQKGHCTSTAAASTKALDFFNRTNGFYPDSIGTNIGTISKYNNEVDIKSRNVLNDKITTESYYKDPLFTYVNNDDMEKYNRLTDISLILN